jgi:hypothetical protein
MRPFLAAFTRLRLRRRRTVLIVAAFGAALALGGAGGASAAATGPNLVTGHSGVAVTRVSAVTQDTAVIYTSGAWTTVTSTSVYALNGQWVDARFTAESACYGTAGSWCAVRILVDGVESEPVVATDFAFNSATASGGQTGWASHSVERVKTVGFAGSHSVVVQAASIGSVSHRLDDYTLLAYVLTP